ncbi:MAG: NADH-quinone oxidoreductase subunit NuoH [candidate division Zixibacteria bacterium]|nr:NADH-quinone oxidoreductase subunit NuoH [candidate division Zixibacteria bacterium]NIR64239.1 NADH-quinone oxidoreductase subunit NuoH [candidate division Zixibacteria bacterium]NIS15813.1 NADH-quinone oxidoreductase subunit NuoH [candidate division Zixibacteria bacterium]NIS46139.1 NADH-quinone oxidoreductase subunit NuoH [candidate division Zixibacteria bacterium]NIT53081.1 NADH-quinone oxidoreductase subunit NuoH [candidate division Zixibacteria bacterium]
MARFQTRLGPIYTGPNGLLQPVADLVKLLFKEDIIPEHVDKKIYVIAPMAAFIPATLSIVVIPFGSSITIFGREIDLVLSDLNVGVLYVFAITSIGVYSIILSGWSSNSKYSLLGSIRSSAQMISYEVSMGLAVVSVVLVSGSLNLNTIVAHQENLWHIFSQPVAFMIFLVCGIAETNRAPFDLPEAESELVAGYHTEYSAMKFGMFFVGEYANMITVSAMATTLFLGGWQGPGDSGILSMLWFAIKVFIFLFLYLWLRATLPRFRYDQLMNFGWKVLLPLAILNVLVTSAVVLII